MKFLVIFFLSHLGAFVLVRDLLETSGIRAIQDANGSTDNTVANFAQVEGEYVLPKEQISDSETLNYLFFGKALIAYMVEQIRTGKALETTKELTNTIKSYFSGEEELVVSFVTENDKGEITGAHENVSSKEVIFTTDDMV